MTTSQSRAVSSAAKYSLLGGLGLLTTVSTITPAYADAADAANPSGGAAANCILPAPDLPPDAPAKMIDIKRLEARIDKVEKAQKECCNPCRHPVHRVVKPKPKPPVEVVVPPPPPPAPPQVTVINPPVAIGSYSFGDAPIIPIYGGGRGGGSSSSAIAVAAPTIVVAPQISLPNINVGVNVNVAGPVINNQVNSTVTPTTIIANIANPVTNVTNITKTGPVTPTTNVSNNVTTGSVSPYNYVSGGVTNNIAGPSSSVTTSANPSSVVNFNQTVFAGNGNGVRGYGMANRPTMTGSVQGMRHSR